MADTDERMRIAFTGKLASMTRREAWCAARTISAEPMSHVSHRTSVVVIGREGWPLLADGKISHKLRRAVELKHAGCPIRIIPETDFLTMIGRPADEDALRKWYPGTEVCRIMKIDRATLRKWEQFDLVRPREGFYEFQDLVAIQTIQGLLSSGVRLDVIASSVQSLSSLMPGMERPLAQLRVFAENPDMVLVAQGEARFSPGGQMMLNFEARPVATNVLRLGPNTEGDAKKWMQIGISFQEEGLYGEAAESFRTVLKLEPSSFEAHLRLGDVLRELGILWAAEEFYGLSLQLQPGSVAAWVSMAAVQEEQGKTEAAIASYETALGMAQDCSDAHFNLALCYEKTGARTNAAPHWFAYLKLDPAGPSAAVARSHLSVPTRC